jgi:hypothetical protein
LRPNWFAKGSQPADYNRSFRRKEMLLKGEGRKADKEPIQSPARSIKEMKEGLTVAIFSVSDASFSLALE